MTETSVIIMIMLVGCCLLASIRWQLVKILEKLNE